MMRKRITASAALLLIFVVPVLVGACSAKDVKLPNQPDLPGVDFPVAAAIACFIFNDQPGIVSFEDRSTGAPSSWSWDFGDGRTSVEQHPKHRYAGGGKFFVSLTVRDARTTDTVGTFAVPGAGCTTAFCGDGTVDFDEECDDGNNVNEDGCNGACAAEFCGDGIVQVRLGEECDDGNVIPGDGCEAGCTLLPPPV